jgi:hypothetical protein
MFICMYVCMHACIYMHLVLLKVVHHGQHVLIHDDDPAQPVRDSDSAPTVAWRRQRRQFSGLGMDLSAILSLSLALSLALSLSLSLCLSPSLPLSLPPFLTSSLPPSLHPSLPPSPFLSLSLCLALPVPLSQALRPLAVSQCRWLWRGRWPQRESAPGRRRRSGVCGV